ncbi:LysR substrate-binding domain-containing protein, partial [Burkholderia pseudomallei]
NVTAHADNMDAIALLILSGHHLGYLPRHFAAPFVEQGLLKALNPATLCYDVTFDVVRRRGARGDPIVQAFLDDLTHAPRGGAAQ